jgi:formate/nitrite transporter FocA (FNT family)
MNRLFIRRNITTSAIVLFVALFCAFLAFKPSFLYNTNGCFKRFGLGCRQKTVIPIWLVVFILAILCYLFVMYYLAMPRLKY